MPELPEVEVVRRGLQRWVVGSRVEGVQVLEPRSVRRHVGGARDLADRLRGTVITSVRRRGKYCWLETDHDDCLVVHLGMSGQVLLQPPDAPAERHLRARIALSGGPASREGRELRFVDQRMFGGLHVCDLVADTAADVRLAAAQSPPRAREGGAPTDGCTPVDGAPVDGSSVDGSLADAAPTDGVPPGGERMAPAAELAAAYGDRVPATVVHVARDLLDPALDLERLAVRVSARRTGVKRALLDQTLVSGVGNIYADEALFRAGVHGDRTCRDLPPTALVRILVAGAEVMTAALAAGGTSFDSLYVDVNGSSGWFSRSLAVYGREGLACPRCGTDVVRSAFMNRSSFWCPRCQVAPDRAG